MYKTLAQMDAKEKNAIMKDVIRDYKEVKSKYQLLINHNFYPKSDYSSVKERAVFYNNTEIKMINYMEQKEELLAKLAYYDAIISQLDERSREIVEKDFIDHDPSWWICYYSKSTYYRTRRKAIDSFLSFIID